MGGVAPAAALVVAAAALPSSPHIGVRAARGIRSRALLAFAPCPPACPRWRRWRRGRGAKGCAPVAAGSLRPPCCRLRPSFAGSGGGWSLGGALAIKKGANVARVPSLPARRRARARVRLRGKQRWGGLLAPSGGCAAAAPPPPPPVKCWGRGLWLSCVRCGGVAPAAAGAKNAPERQYFSFSTKFDTFRKSAVLCWRQANMRRQTLLKPKRGKGSERTLA